MTQNKRDEISGAIVAAIAATGLPVTKTFNTVLMLVHASIARSAGVTRAEFLAACEDAWLTAGGP